MALEAMRRVGARRSDAWLFDVKARAMRRLQHGRMQAGIVADDDTRLAAFVYLSLRTINFG